MLNTKHRVLNIKLLLIISFFIYCCIIFMYLSFESAKMIADVDIAKYFSPDRIAKGKLFANERIMIYITDRLIYLVLLLLSARIFIVLKFYEKILIISRRIFIFADYLYSFIILTLVSVIMLPVKLYSYKHLLKNNIIHTTLKLFIYDYAVQSLILVFTISLVLSVSIFVYKKSKNMFPLIMTFLVTLYVFIGIWLSPMIITPLFNDFKPLNDSPLKNEIIEISNKAGVDIKNIYVMDASKRTYSANAYIFGLFNTKEMVLYDNLLRDYSNDEIKYIICHEINHYVENDVVKGILLYPQSNVLILFILFSLLMKIYKDSDQPALKLPVILAVYLMLNILIMQPAAYAVSRRMERDSDYMALKITGNPSAMISTQVKLGTLHSLKDYDPSAWYRFFFSSHPSTKERIGMAESFKKSDSK